MNCSRKLPKRPWMHAILFRPAARPNLSYGNYISDRAYVYDTQGLVTAFPITGMRKRCMPMCGPSDLFALIVDVQPELEAFKPHQHAPEVIPCHFAAIDDKQRNTSVAGVVPLDPAADHVMVCDA